jgi:hypothetical protein
LGQELELDNEIDKFKDYTEKAKESVGDENDEDENKNSKGDEIINKSFEDPTIGIVMLSREIEREIVNITASMGLLKEIQNKPISHKFQLLIESKYLADSILQSVKTFWDLRNKIVHGKTIEDEKQINNRCQTQSLFFGKLFVLFYYFRFVLMEKTRSPSPRLRLAAKRYCSLFFPIFVCGNGKFSVAKPRLRLSPKRPTFRQVRS